MIKVSYLVSYDYNYLMVSLNQLYEYVDKIVISIDVDRKTWSGNDFEIPEVFFEDVKKYDTRNIIEFYFDKFYLEDLTAIECESRQRNLVLDKLGKGWKIQLDVDEYVYDFEKVARYLNKYWYLNLFPKFTPICFKGCLITLYKKIDEGFLYIENGEQFTFITNQCYNTHTRQNSNVRKIYTNIKVIHQSWARENFEIKQKINNWGHRDDFDTQKYYDFWYNLNVNNYKNYFNFHPLKSEVWDKLCFMPSKTIEDYILNYSLKNKQSLIPINRKQLFNALFNKIFK